MRFLVGIEIESARGHSHSLPRISRASRIPCPIPIMARPAGYHPTHNGEESKGDAPGLATLSEKQRKRPKGAAGKRYKPKNRNREANPGVGMDSPLPGPPEPVSPPSP